MEGAFHLTTTTTSCHCKEGTEVDRRGNPLHAMDAFEEYEALSDSQHIPKGLRSSQ